MNKAIAIFFFRVLISVLHWYTEASIVVLNNSLKILTYICKCARIIAKIDQ